MPGGNSSKPRRHTPREAHDAVPRIQQLYAVEHEAQELHASARATLSQENSTPVLAAMQEYFDTLAVTVLPKSPLGEAVTHARNRSPTLTAYTTDDPLPIGNNLAERPVKPFTIGRKN